MLIRNMIIHILANLGSWICRKAIRMAGGGYIEFEVATPIDPFRRFRLYD
jgi:hypothetical protein